MSEERPEPDPGTQDREEEPPSLMDILKSDVKERLGAKEPAPEVPPAIALAAITGLGVPRIAVTIHTKTAEEAVERLRKIPDSVPEHVARHPVQIEVRLDTIEDDNDRAQVVFLIARLGVPVIVTHRSPREGGSGNASDKERQDLLSKILASLSDPFPPGSLIDLEASTLAGDPEGWKAVLEAARAKHLHLLVSHHDHHATPTDPDRLRPPKEIMDTPAGPALVYKSSTRTNTWEEELSVVAALREANLSARQYAIMGMGRPTSRLLAPYYGAPLVYASTSGEEEPAALGQVPFDDLLNTWTRWGITYEDKGLLADPESQEPPPRLALIGRPAIQSLSPAMINAAARHQELPHRYFPLQPPEGPTPGQSLANTLPWLRRLNIVGGNATAPYKQALAEAADRLEGAARKLGAANTFRYDGDRLVATNTDVNGIRDPLEAAGLKIPEERVLILGAGASAAAAALALQDAASLTITNRTRANAQALVQRLGTDTPLHIAPWEERADIADASTLIIQCTSLGMEGTPGAGEDPLAPYELREDQTLYELVYDPLETPLLERARDSGARVLDGLAMLVAQGAASHRFWLDKEPPLDVMRKAVEEARKTPLPQRVRAAMQQIEQDPELQEGTTTT